jgi:hypothetical protein
MRGCEGQRSGKTVLVEPVLLTASGRVPVGKDLGGLSYTFVDKGDRPLLRPVEGWWREKAGH